MNDFDSTEHQARLKELYRDFEAAGMTPLWLTREGLMLRAVKVRAVEAGRGACSDVSHDVLLLSRLP